MRAEDEQDPEPITRTDSSLRGSFVAVLLMAAFFFACWFGVFAIALDRR